MSLYSDNAIDFAAACYWAAWASMCNARMNDAETLESRESFHKQAKEDWATAFRALGVL